MVFKGIQIGGQKIGSRLSHRGPCKRYHYKFLRVEAAVAPCAAFERGECDKSFLAEGRAVLINGHVWEEGDTERVLVFVCGRHCIPGFSVSS